MVGQETVARLWSTWKVVFLILESLLKISQSELALKVGKGVEPR